MYALLLSLLMFVATGQVVITSNSCGDILSSVSGTIQTTTDVINKTTETIFWNQACQSISTTSISMSNGSITENPSSLTTQFTVYDQNGVRQAILHEEVLLDDISNVYIRYSAYSPDGGTLLAITDPTPLHDPVQTYYTPEGLQLANITSNPETLCDGPSTITYQSTNYSWIIQVSALTNLVRNINRDDTGKVTPSTCQSLYFTGYVLMIGIPCIVGFGILSLSFHWCWKRGCLRRICHHKCRRSSEPMQTYEGTKRSCLPLCH